MTMIIAAAENVLPGFNEPTIDAQRVFRRVLEAMAHPGRILTVPADLVTAPAGLSPAAAAVGLTLLDNETMVWTDLPEASASRAWLRFHCGAPFTADPGRAAFGLIATPGAGLALDRFFPGTDEAPETSATLIVEVDALLPDKGLRLSGPGIHGLQTLQVRGLPEDFWSVRQRICRSHPLGLDILLVCGNLLAGLPRTTIVNG
jgi:alpha-D-ribose 1-methylphosphonate 5-triphosphate synthase subunit PhnH